MKLFYVYPLYDVTPTLAKDVYVYDSTGTEYLDLYGGHAVISIGHGHYHYVKSLTKQLNEISFYSKSRFDINIIEILNYVSLIILSHY